ncbi:NADAR family protein [Ralstonia pickettii]|uniref:NADAR family protein n=1 Tax=Ralstonia pickettii TaxID=329 RepID=UPI0021760A40|nr:NADAR family protein [Ralstonia pickettii]
MIASELFFMGLMDVSLDSREGYRSIFHYWESEKYRGVDEGVRQEILAAPTLRELRKMLRRLPETWRSDWKQVRGRVFRSALLYAVESHPDLQKELIEPGGLIEACSNWGIPDAFVMNELKAVRQEIESPFRLLAVGSVDAPPEHVQATLERLIGKRSDCQYVTFAGRRMDVGLHLWAAQKMYPIHYVRTKLNSGIDGHVVQQLIAKSTHVVFFTREGTAPDADYIERARQQGCSVRLSQYSPPSVGRSVTATGARAGRTADGGASSAATQRRPLRVVQKSGV